MEVEAAKMIGAGLAVIALAGVGIGIGNIFSALVTSIARNPAARGEVFGIGIESGAVRRFYDKCVVLNDISELETELIDRMSNVLVGGEWDARRVAS